HVPVVLADSGGGGGLALSADQRTLFVNEGYQLASFDARSASAGPVVRFGDDNIGAGSAHRWWLPTLTEAQAALDASRGLAVDPQGRWVAAVGFNDPQLRGIWLIGTSGRLHLIRRFYQSAALTALAFSREGAVLYALDGTALLLLDPETGRTIKRFTYPATVAIELAHGTSKRRRNANAGHDCASNAKTQRDAEPHAGADSDTDANPDAESHPDANSNAHSDADPNANSNSNSNSNPGAPGV